MKTCILTHTENINLDIEKMMPLWMKNTYMIYGYIGLTLLKIYFNLSVLKKSVTDFTFVMFWTYLLGSYSFVT